MWCPTTTNPLRQSGQALPRYLQNSPTACLPARLRRPSFCRLARGSERVLPNRDRKYLHCRILAVSGRIFLATSISPNVEGPLGSIFERPQAPVAYARGSERALPSRDRKGVGACLVPATPG